MNPVLVPPRSFRFRLVFNPGGLFVFALYNHYDSAQTPSSTFHIILVGTHYEIIKIGSVFQETIPGLKDFTLRLELCPSLLKQTL